MNEFDDLILGITDIHGYTHDNSVAILKKGKILFAASEERYTRIKHDGSFPKQSLEVAFRYLNLKLSSINTVAIGYPKRKAFSVLYNRYFYESTRLAVSILINRNFKLLKDLSISIKLLYEKFTKEKVHKIFKNRKIIYVDHHLAHAASAYYSSGFGKCISIALDAFGSQLSGQIRSGAVFLCKDGKMKEVLSAPVFGSLGLFYMSVTYVLGFKPGDGEGKTMGLAAYGNPKKLYKLLKPYSPTFNEGTWIPGKDWLAGILPSMPKVGYLFNSTRFGQLLKSLINKNKKENVAAAAQKILEEELVKLVKYLIKKYPHYNNICLSGGVFLNVKANKKIMEIPGVKNIFIQPNAGDGGVALGAAFIATPKKNLQKIINQPLLNCGLGQSFTDSQIRKALRQYVKKIVYQRHKNIISYTVKKILEGKVIGWFQGRAEWGPRALGFRSVLADPRNIKIKDRINEVLKNREWFMPFAPSILEEEGETYFKNFRSAPFMTMVFDVNPKKAKLFIAALHVDKTARPNTVNKKNNIMYYLLLKEWLRKTGLPILLNTSFNRHGLPIVNSPGDAIDHLIMGAVDELIIGNHAVVRNDKN